MDAKSMKPAIEALTNNQRQLDADGCEVGVSRQALDETLAWTEELRQEAHSAHLIIGRVWKALNIQDYSAAKGKALDELVAEAVEKAWRYDELSK